MENRRHRLKSFARVNKLDNKSLISRINWINCVIVFGIPLLSLYGLCTLRSFIWQTWVLAIVYYIYSGLGITAGYHRLWSHNSYSCTLLFEIFLMSGGTAALQRPILWWCYLHRIHHRYPDTNIDPYSIEKGFFYAHMGWLLLDNNDLRNEYKSISINKQDLRNNKIAIWQNKNYYWFAPFMSFIFPTILSYFLCNGDIHGGFFIVGSLRLLIAYHSTWCVNSVAHYIGKSTFDDTISPKDSFITSLLTLGEGYHNFHHEFANDYRNGVRWWDFDPTKWLIFLMSYIGLTYDLKIFPKNEIDKGRIYMMEKQIIKEKKSIKYGVDIQNLPLWTKNYFEIYQEENKKKILIVINEIVHDLTKFIENNKHPGGKSIIIQRNGKNVTNDFNGNIYNHTNAARNLMSFMRIAKIINHK